MVLIRRRLLDAVAPIQQVPHTMAQPLAALFEAGHRPGRRACRIPAGTRGIAKRCARFHDLQHVLCVRLPVSGHVQQAATAQFAGQQADERRLHNAPLVVPGFRPGVGEEQQDPVQAVIVDTAVQHVDRVITENAHIVQVVLGNGFQQPADAGAVNLDADEIAVRLRAGHGREVRAVAESDFQRERRPTAESGRRIESLLCRQAVARPQFVESLLLAGGQPAFAADKGADAPVVRVCVMFAVGHWCVPEKRDYTDLLENYLNKALVWVGGLDFVSLGWETAVLALAFIGAAFVHRTLGRFLIESTSATASHDFRRITLHSLQRIVFPLSMLLGTVVGKAILLQFGQRILLLKLAVPLLLSLAGIRLTVYVLRKTFRSRPVIKAWEHVISTAIWVLVALHLVGWLPQVTKTLDAVGYTFGSVRISLFTVLQLIVVVGVLMVLAAWLAKAVEQGLSRSTHLSPGLKVGLGKTFKFGLYTLAGLLALNAVGIDLGALTVFGGALGVGIGFGLQRIASNFISGFILVFDGSIRPGDVISINDKFGWVQELRARYIVVRDRDGVETLIPNENLITTEVINWSYSDPRVRLKLPVQISYADDPEQAMQILIDASEASGRVLRDPAPAARLMGFGEHGIDLELRVWIYDPQEGVANVRSDINLNIWKRFREAGITIPFPQHDLYVKELPAS
jgi:small-conductance mechanosensitive channel